MSDFRRRRFEEILRHVIEYLHSRISPDLVLDEKSGLGNISRSVADQLAEVWEALEAVHHAYDLDNGDDDQVTALAGMVGVNRRPATKGLAYVQPKFASAAVYAPGTVIASVYGQPGNRWVNRDYISTADGVTFLQPMDGSPDAGTYQPYSVFVSEFPGRAAVAPANSILVRASSQFDFLSINNTDAATPGSDIEDIQSLLEHRRVILASQPYGTEAQLLSQVLRTSGVVSAKLYYNKTPFPLTIIKLDGSSYAIPPFGFELVYVGPISSFTRNAIAQAILLNRPSGSFSAGELEGSTYDYRGFAYGTERMTRAEQKSATVDITVVGSVSRFAVRDAINAYFDALAQGQSIVWNDLLIRILALPNLIDVPSLVINGIGGYGYSYPISERAVWDIVTNADISVNGSNSW